MAGAMAGGGGDGGGGLSDAINRVMYYLQCHYVFPTAEQVRGALTLFEMNEQLAARFLYSRAVPALPAASNPFFGGATVPTKVHYTMDPRSQGFSQVPSAYNPTMMSYNANINIPHQDGYYPNQQQYPVPAPGFGANQQYNQNPHAVPHAQGGDQAFASSAAINMAGSTSGAASAAPVKVTGSTGQPVRLQDPLKSSFDQSINRQGLPKTHQPLGSQPESSSHELDMSVDEFVHRYCGGSLVKYANLHYKVPVRISKRRGSYLLCQGYRAVIFEYFVKGRSWGGSFGPENLRVTKEGVLLINLASNDKPILKDFLEDLKRVTESLLDLHFLLDGQLPIYVCHLKGLCEKLHEMGADELERSGNLNKYIELIFYHMAFGHSTDRAILIKGIGIPLKGCSSDEIEIIRQSMEKARCADDPKHDWRTKLKGIDVLVAVYNEGLAMGFRPQVSGADNFMFCRHACEHGVERALIKSGEKGNQEVCPYCKHSITTDEQRFSIKQEMSKPDSNLRYVAKRILSGERPDQTQPLNSPRELEILIGFLFDKFVAQSICELVLEPALDQNKFIHDCWSAFKRSIPEKWNDLDDDDDGSGDDRKKSPLFWLLQREEND